jgi:hypothetical protein
VEDGAGSDGGRMLFEARKGSRYQVVYYWQPENEPLGEAARQLLLLAGDTIPEGLLPRR